MAYITVGKVKDAHGLKGELYILLFAKEAAWLPHLKELRLKASEQAPAQTYAIKSARFHKDGLIVLSPDIKGRTQAEGLKGQIFEIPEELLVSQSGQSIYLREIAGFAVSLPERGVVGTVVDFGSNGAQDLLVIRTADGDFEVPFVEAFVSKMDFANRVLEMNLPIGLLGELTEDDE